MGLGEIRLGEMGLGEMGLGDIKWDRTILKSPVPQYHRNFVDFTTLYFYFWSYFTVHRTTDIFRASLMPPYGVSML